MQIGDGSSGTDRLAPVAVSGLSAGVVMVSAGGVRARIVCLRLCVLGMMLGAYVCVACLPELACIGGSLDGF